jgi:hypothetical protein
MYGAAGGLVFGLIRWFAARSPTKRSRKTLVEATQSRVFSEIAQFAGDTGWRIEIPSEIEKSTIEAAEWR